jgi:hypothetical protein
MDCHMSNGTVHAPDPDLWLSTQVTLRRYLAMEAAKDINGIAKFIHGRFAERYLTPLKNVRAGDESGFLTMGVCCLLIEGLMAFREGWPTTEGKSKKAFELFFSRESRFSAFLGFEVDFWKGVRCGILHQGETNKGWRLNFTDRSKPLLETDKKRINCIQFELEMETVLNEYKIELTNAAWNSDVWLNLRKKMEQTVKDCVA